MSVNLITGDCLAEIPHLMPGSVQAVITSPPYNIGKAYEERSTQEAYTAWLRAVILAIEPVIAVGGSLCLQVGTYVAAGEIVPIDVLAYPAIKEAGLKLRNRVAWIHDHGAHAKRRFSGRYETILWATKGEPYFFDLDSIRVPQKHPGKLHYKGPKKGQLSCHPMGKNPGDVWEITQVKAQHPEKTAHPCQFPEALVSRLVLGLTRPGDTVLDPFAGSGTVGAVCEREGRHSVLIERDPAYVEIARRRITSDLFAVLALPGDTP